MDAQRSQAAAALGDLYVLAQQHVPGTLRHGPAAVPPVLPPPRPHAPLILPARLSSPLSSSPACCPPSLLSSVLSATLRLLSTLDTAHAMIRVCRWDRRSIQRPPPMPPPTARGTAGLLCTTFPSSPGCTTPTPRIRVRPCLSLTFHCLFTAFPRPCAVFSLPSGALAAGLLCGGDGERCATLPFPDLSLPFLELSLSFHCLSRCGRADGVRVDLVGQSVLQPCWPGPSRSQPHPPVPRNRMHNPIGSERCRHCHRLQGPALAF